MAERAVISDVMAEKGVSTEEIPNEAGFSLDSLSKRSLRYFKCKGFASFDSHAGCHRSWKSAHAWCVLDLRKQRIAHRFTQDCQKCDGSASPEFDSEAMRRMAEWAVGEYLIRSGREKRPQRDLYDFDDLRGALEEDDRPPHDEGRCEMCKALGRSCWKRPI